jgi:NAD-dependent deacetylase
VLANMKKLVVLTGAGMSAESGIPTFRGADGLWEGHRIEEVASPQGWDADQDLVLHFYNLRRKNVLESEPNRGHLILAELQNDFDIQIITQNIDDLHERAGSKEVMHLHGEIRKSRSTLDPSLVYDIDGWKLGDGDKCARGSQLRPHIVWFGEAVPLIEPAADICRQADAIVVVGTSMVVYPAAGLIHYAEKHIPKFIIDPNIPAVSGVFNVTPIELGASEGLQILRDLLD